MNTKMEKKFESESGLDRISELPKPIKAHILSFLETRDAVRTSILSSSWREFATLLPNLDFSSKYLITSPMGDTCLSFCTCGKGDEASRVKRENVMRMREGFYAFLDRAFASRLELDKFKLYALDFGPDFISRLDRWVVGAVRRRVKEFELEICEEKYLSYSLPKSILTSNSIVKLKLQKCEFNLSAKMDNMLPSLQELCLEYVTLNEMELGSLLHSCLNLENLTIRHCDGFSYLKIDGHMKLEKLNVEQFGTDMEAIKIVAPNLLELSYKYDSDSIYDKCLFEMDGCENVKLLEISSFLLDDVDLNTFLEKLPLLESLVLQFCDSLACVEIYNQHLIKLDVDTCRALVQIRADTPNLKYFSYSGKDPISFVSKGSALKLKNASLSLKSNFRGDKFNGLVKLLAKLSHSESLELSVATEKDVMVPETLRAKFRPPLFAVKHLTTKLHVSMLNSPVEVVDSLLWLAPCPESISISYYNSSPHLLIEFLYEKPMKGKKKCGCWKSSINCWRHTLKRVTIKNCGRGDNNTKLVNFFEKERINGKIECFNKNKDPDYTRDDSCSSFE